MKKWTTSVKAIDPVTGEVKLWQGPYVDAPTFDLAEQWCRENAGYLTVNTELVEEQDEFDSSIVVNYENVSLN